MNEGIRNIQYNRPYKLPRKSLANSLLQDINEHGLPIGLEKFKEYKKNGYLCSKRKRNEQHYCNPEK